MTAAKVQAPMLMHMNYKVHLPDRDFSLGTRHRLTPSVYAGIKVKEDCQGRKEAVTYSGPTYVATRSGKHSSSTATTHAKDFDRLLELPDFVALFKTSDVQLKPVLFMSVYGGPDENPRYKLVIRHAISRFLKHDLHGLFVFRNAPGRSVFNRVERRLVYLSRALAGLILPHDYFGNHLDGN